MKMNKIYKTLIICSLFLCFNVFAATEKDAQKFIEDLSTNVISYIKNDKVNDNEKSAKLTNLFIKAINIKWIAKFVLGSNFRDLSDIQFNQFIDNYQGFLVSKYVPKFRHYNREVIKILGVENIEQDRFRVSTMIDRVDEADVKVDYLVKYDAKEGFKIFDIIAEDISMITTHRTEFTSLIQQKGFESMMNFIKDEKLSKIN